MTYRFVTLPLAMVRPDRAFKDQSAHRLPKALLVLLLFLVYVTGMRLVQGYYENPQAKMLAIQDVSSRMSGLMESAPTEVQDQTRGQMLDSILGQRSGIMTSVSIAFSGIVFLLVVVELWLVSSVASQFFGGQEERRGKDRDSWTLFLIAFIPVALRKLAEGIVMSLRDPEAAGNALTLADYRRLSAAHFDLSSLLSLGFSNPFLAAMGRFLTDPFFLWAWVILWFGGREVYHIPLRSAVFLSLILVLVLGLQTALLARIGVQWEM
jgi:hypothetical protein